MLASPETIEQLRDAVCGLETLCATGAGSKPNLSRNANLSLARLRGVVEYDPCEYTITARAGTTLAELQQILADKGQYLPFDPPLVRRGATLGGTVAAGLSGPGSLRHGTLRDFLLGVRFVTGDGKIVFGGGKVVKNAAGFDFPKLMVGSLGQLGVLAELTLKVFPLPAHATTLQCVYESRLQAIEAMRRLAISRLEPACLDVAPADEMGHSVWVRIAGAAAAVPARIERTRNLLQRPAAEADDCSVWNAAREFQWLPSNVLLVKVGGPLDDLTALVDTLAIKEYRLSLAGHVLWLGWPQSQPIESLENQLRQFGLAALALGGGEAPALIGQCGDNPFLQRIRQAIDPCNRLIRKDAHVA